MSDPKIAYALVKYDSTKDDLEIEMSQHINTANKGVGGGVYNVTFDTGYFASTPVVSVTPFRNDKNYGWVASATIGEVDDKEVDFSMADLAGNGVWAGFSIIALGS